MPLTPPPNSTIVSAHTIREKLLSATIRQLGEGALRWFDYYVNGTSEQVGAFEIRCPPVPHFTEGEIRMAVPTALEKQPAATEARQKGAAPGGPPPSGDNRYKILESTMKRHQYQPDALIEVLHHAQQLWGYLEDDLLLYIARKLKVPPSRVYGVATFYHFFSLKPQGKHACVVCLGTACYVKGAPELLAAVEKLAEIKPGETTEDGTLSLLTARCIGACGIAPVVVADGTVAGRQTADSVAGTVKEWLQHGSE